MPFTPFHLGPGAAFKAFGGRYFSFMVFGFSQVAMDIEVLVRILRGDSPLHGFTHIPVPVGATLIGIVSVLIGKPVCECFLGYRCSIPIGPLRLEKGFTIETEG